MKRIAFLSALMFIWVSNGGFMKMTDIFLSHNHWDHTFGIVGAAGVRAVAPSHCTGDTAIEIFNNSWGKGYITMFLGDEYKTAL